MIELHHDWDSLMSFKVRACLAEKELHYESHIVELTRFAHLRPEYLAMNPNGVVPTLVHDGTVVVESSVINEYLEECFPAVPLLPRDAAARSRVRAWVKYGDDVLHHGIRPATFELMIKPRLHSYSQAELEQLIANHPQPVRAQAFRNAAADDIDFDRVAETYRVAETVFGRVQQALAYGDYLVGNVFTFADLMAMSFIDRIDHLGLAFVYQRRPAVSDWVHRLVSRPAFLASLPPAGTRLPAPDPALLASLPERFS